MTAPTSQMTIQRTDLNPCTVVLEVECTPQQVREAINKTLRRASKRVRIPGFRPGTAPPEVVKKHVNLEVVKEWAAEEAVNLGLKDALKQEAITPYRGTRPRLEAVEFDFNAATCSFTVKVPLEPKIALGEYKGLSATKPDAQVTDDAVDEYIEQLRSERASKQPVETRGAQHGDQAVVLIRPEDKSLGEKAFAVSVGQTFPSLDEALLGMKAEDVRTVEITFPSDFSDASWAGKTLKCEIEIRSLTAPVLPDLDEAFAQSLNADSVEELRSKVRGALERAVEQRNRHLVQEQLLTRLMESSTIELPDPLWEDVADRRLEELERDLQASGKTLDEAAAEEGTTSEKVREHFRNAARSEVARAMAIRHIAEKENLKITNQDVIAQALSIAMREGVEPETVLEAYRRANRLDELRFQALYDKVLSFLEEHAVITSEAAG